jgi:hypothetical protein
MITTGSIVMASAVENYITSAFLAGDPSRFSSSFEAS